MTTPGPASPDRRREFRAWVRAHHPDAGGDPAEFVAGLARWRQELGDQAAGLAPGPAGASRAGAGRPAPVTVIKTRHGLWLVTRWWQRRRGRRGAPRVR